MSNDPIAVHGKQRKRGLARFSLFHMAQMVLSTVLLIVASIIMVGGGYKLGGLFMVAGTILGLINLESD